MKKFFLLLAFPALLSVTAQAQDDSADRKPDAGSVTTEVNLGLFNSGVTINNIVNQLRGRYFLSPTSAVRLGLNATSNTQTTDATNSGDYSFKFKNSSFTLSPGIEKHFAGTERLSPFIGAEVAFTVYNVGETRERETGSPKLIEYVNARTNGGGSNTLIDRSYVRTGLNAIAGVDYYFAKHFYAGLEVGYGLAITRQKDAERQVDANSDFKITGNKTISLGAYANNGIRLGFVF